MKLSICSALRFIYPHRTMTCNVIYENIYFSALRFISQHRSLSAKSENWNCFNHDGPEEAKQRNFQLATALGLQVSAHGSGCPMYNFFIRNRFIRNQYPNSRVLMFETLKKLQFNSFKKIHISVQKWRKLCFCKKPQRNWELEIIRNWVIIRAKFLL